MIGREQDFYTHARAHAKAIWDGLAELEALQKEWNALDYGTTMEDGAGANDGLVKGDVGAVVFDTANAIRAVMNTGHATNVAKLL